MMKIHGALVNISMGRRSRYSGIHSSRQTLSRQSRSALSAGGNFPESEYSLNKSVITHWQRPSSLSSFQPARCAKHLDQMRALKGQTISTNFYTWYIV